GKYFATLDSDQLGKINMKGTPTRIDFELEQSIDGDYIDHLEFFLHPGEKQPQHTISKPETPIKKTEIKENYPSPDISSNMVSDSKDTLYSIQIIALKSHNGIYEHLLPLLANYPKIVVRESYGSDHFYRYSAGEFKSRQEARNLLKIIHQLGWKEAFITQYIPSNAKSTITNLIGYIPEKANFVIQLHALRQKLEDMTVFDKILDRLTDVSVRWTKGNDGFFRYNAGCFNTRKDAIGALRTIRSLGWKDAFIVKVTNDSE
ncbi:MAG: SPOR domain-containing protein, partial [Bacteroidales bacterium]